MSIEQQEPKVQTQTSATQRRYRTLAVVRQEAITRVEKPLERLGFRLASPAGARIFRLSHRHGDGYTALDSH